jgi:hypothetical protein
MPQADGCHAPSGSPLSGVITSDDGVSPRNLSLCAIAQALAVWRVTPVDPPTRPHGRERSRVPQARRQEKRRYGRKLSLYPAQARFVVVQSLPASVERAAVEAQPVGVVGNEAVARPHAPPKDRVRARDGIDAGRVYVREDRGVRRDARQRDDGTDVLVLRAISPLRVTICEMRTSGSRLALTAGLPYIAQTRLKLSRATFVRCRSERGGSANPITSGMPAPARGFRFLAPSFSCRRVGSSSSSSPTQKLPLRQSQILSRLSDRATPLTSQATLEPSICTR